MVLDLGWFKPGGKATSELRKGRHCFSSPTPISLDHKWHAHPTQFLTLPVIIFMCFLFMTFFLIDDYYFKNMND